MPILDAFACEQISELSLVHPHPEVLSSFFNALGSDPRFFPSLHNLKLTLPDLDREWGLAAPAAAASKRKMRAGYGALEAFT